MNNKKDSNGWPTAIFIVLFSLLASYFFLWSPANKQASEAQREVQEWQEKVANPQGEKVLADEQTIQLAAEAQRLTTSKLSAELERLGIKKSNITNISGDRQRLEIVGSLSEVSNLISATSGQTYFDREQQIRGSELVVEVKYRLQPLNNNQYLLQADFQLLESE